MSMRRAASACQVLHRIAEPRGARMGRGPGPELGWVPGWGRVVAMAHDMAGLGRPLLGEAFSRVEGGLLGVTASAGAPLAPGGVTDSVESDDGAVDGSGAAGRSFFSDGGSAGVTLTFSPVAIGFAPTRVGVVWTDGLWHDHPPGVGHDGQLARHGLGAIRLWNSIGGIELDHVQYSLTTPAAGALRAVGALSGARCRR